MNDGTTLARVKAIIGDHAGLPADEIGDDLAIGEPVLIDGNPVGLDLDSLDRLELIVAFTEHFDIDIPDADADKPEMSTAAGIAAYIDRRMTEQTIAAGVADAPQHLAAALVDEHRTHSEHSAIDDEAPLPPPHVQRMMLERDELTERITKLRAFMEKDDTFTALRGSEQILLRQQLGHMIGYQSTLNQRLLLA